MSQTKSLYLLAGAALALGGVNAALAQQSSSDEVRAIVAEMQADAQSRSSLLAAGGAGHDGQFYLASPDGSFRLNVGGQIQFRYIMDFRDSSAAGVTDDFSNGFQTRRTKLTFDGNIINADWTYKVQTNFDRADGNAGLEDAWVAYNFGNGWKLQWGQFKLPFMREELVSSRRQLAVERSVVNEVFNQDYSQGVQVAYEELDWRAALAFSDGFGSRNTDFNSLDAGGASLDAEADYAFTGRFEYKFAGDWKQFEDFTSEQGSPYAAMVGGALHWQQDTNTGAPGDVDFQYLSYTFDASLEGDGWNLFGAFVGNHIEGRVAGTDTPKVDDYGIVLQGGYRIQKETEIFARWDGIWLDSDVVATGNDNFNFITAGVNQYYAGHAAKATVDLVYAVDKTANLNGISNFAHSGGFPSTGLGMLGQDKTGEVAIRFQFQLLF
jgi:phosphate-selective porin OprO/OprP